MMLICLWLPLLLFELISCNGVVDEQDLTVTILENNSLRKYGLPFDVYLTIENTGKTTKNDVILHFIQSPHVTITGVIIDGNAVNKLSSPLQISNMLQTLEKVQVKFSVLLQQETNSLKPVTPGYHVDNILVDVTWIASEITHRSGYNIVVLPFVMPGCDTIFDVKNGMLKKDQVSATSYYLSSSPQEFGENSEGWCAEEVDTKQYIEFLFSSRVRLTSLNSGFRTAKKEWISLYHVQYKLNGEWYFYKQHGQIKNFTGYEGFENNKQPWFLPPLECDGLRIHPKEFHGGLICSKFQIKGCHIPNTDTCIGAVGMINGDIPDESITERYPKSINSTVQQSRLNSKVYGWLGNTTYQDWLQIDLGSLFKITRVAIQGGYDQPHRVTKFRFCSSNNTKKWDCIETGIGRLSTIYQEPEDATSTEMVSIITLDHPITARSFRIEPVEHETLKVVRTELFGCPYEVQSVQEKFDEIKKVHARTVLVSKRTGRIVMCQRKESGSNCFSASENRDGHLQWRALPHHILGVVGMDEDESIFALTNTRTYVINLNNTNHWSDISQEYYLKRSEEKKFEFAFNIPQIIANVESNTFRWTLENMKQIAVSGRGIHVRETILSPWRQVASWSCCGM